MSNLTLVRLPCRPHRVNHVTFFLIRRLFKETPLPQSFLCVVIFFAFLEESSFFFRLNQERCHSNRSTHQLVNWNSSKKKGESYFLVFGSNDTIVKAHVIKTSSSLTFSPSAGALATCREISMLDLPVA